MSDKKNTQLTSASSYNVSRMIFSKPAVGTIEGNPPITFRRINISTLNEDGTKGDLVLETEKLFSFGISENINKETNKVNGHVMAICLWNRDGATKAEKEWTDKFTEIVEVCKQYLLDHKDDIEKYDLEPSDLKKFNPLYWKRDKGKIVKDSGPTLYCKLIESKKQDKILTHFYDDENDEPVDPLTISGRYCYVKGAVKIESIFIGNKISLQVKLYEGTVSLIDGGMKRLLSRPLSSTKVERATGVNPMAEDDENEDDNNGKKSEEKEGSLKGSDNEEDEEDEKPRKPVTPVKPKKVKKVPRKTKKSEE